MDDITLEWVEAAWNGLYWNVAEGYHEHAMEIIHDVADAGFEEVARNMEQYVRDQKISNFLTPSMYAI